MQNCFLAAAVTDKRMQSACDILAEHFEILKITDTLPQSVKVQNLLLPLPAADGGGCCGGLPFEKLVSLVDEGGRVFGGNFGAKQTEFVISRGLICIDYFKSENFKSLNARQTAEGALAILIQRSGKALFESHVALVGFGRIARILAKMLRSMGADVSVFARSERDKAAAAEMGICAFDIPKVYEGRFDAVFCTVPCNILDERRMAAMRCPLWLDLASLPGSFNLDNARALGINAHREGGIPGRFSPTTEGQSIARAVLKELGVGF